MEIVLFTSWTGAVTEIVDWRLVVSIVNTLVPDNANGAVTVRVRW